MHVNVHIKYQNEPRKSVKCQKRPEKGQKRPNKGAKET